MDARDDGAAAAEEGRARRRGLLALAAAIVLAAALGAAARLLAPRAGVVPEPGRAPNAALGQLAGKSPEEVQEELDRIVAEGMFSISIASLVEATPDGEAELRIENVPGNRYLMRVELVRDDTGETVYASGLIEPNSHIQRAPLAMRLEEGTYACTAVFTAVDPETEAAVGTAAAAVEVAVRQ